MSNVFVQIFGDEENTVIGGVYSSYDTLMAVPYIVVDGLGRPENMPKWATWVDAELWEVDGERQSFDDGA